MNEILATILKDTYTLTQLRHRLRVLKSYLENSFFGAKQESETFAPGDLSWLKALPARPAGGPADFLKQFSRDNIYQLFTDLEEKIKKIPTLTMYLTFEPDDLALSQIGEATRGKFGSEILIDSKLDPSLIAGCALVWKGLYKDYSLRAKIRQRENQILESFKKFLRYE